MAKTKKRQPYQELYLEELIKDSSKQIESEEIFDKLLTIIKNGLGDSLSLYEKKWFFNLGSANYQFYKNDNKYGTELKSSLDASCLDDFKFIEVFSDYWNDLEGYKTTIKVKIDYFKTLQNYTTNPNEMKLIIQEIPIPDFEKQADITYLNTKYEEWSLIISNHKNGGDKLLNLLIKYTNKFKEEYIDNRGMGYNWVNSHKKTLFLRSKFMYILGKQIFKNSEYFEITIGQNRIEYNYESHCHVAMRHFSLSVGINNKSHFYKDFDLNNIVNMLPKIFSIANNMHIFNDSIINSKKLFFFEFNNQIYALTVREGKGRHVKYIEVISFYPTEGNKCYEVYSKLTKSNPVILEGKNLVFFH